MCGDSSFLRYKIEILTSLLSNFGFAECSRKSRRSSDAATLTLDSARINVFLTLFEWSAFSQKGEMMRSSAEILQRDECEGAVR